MSDRSGNVWKPIAIVSIVVALLLLCLLAALGCTAMGMFVRWQTDRRAQYRYEYSRAAPAEPTPTPPREAPETSEAPSWLEGGAIITYVEPDSPADRAGLTPGDIITAVDSQPIGEQADLAEVIRGYDPGDTVRIEYRHSRSGTTDRVSVTLGEHPEDSSRPYLGIEYTMMPDLGGGD